jgi:hypothetical protein
MLNILTRPTRPFYYFQNSEKRKKGETYFKMALALKVDYTEEISERDRVIQYLK